MWVTSSWAEGLVTVGMAYRQEVGTSPVFSVRSFWARVQFSEASRPCFFVRISKSPFLKGRRVESSTVTWTHKETEKTVSPGFSGGQRAC